MITRADARLPYPSLIEFLESRRATTPAVGLRFLETGDVDGPTTCWSLAELDRRARVIAARLQALGYARERALLIFPPGLDFIAAFFGCLYAQVVAVPAFPPNPARLDATLPRLQGIIRSSRPALTLTTAALAGVLPMIAEAAPELAVLEAVTVDDAEPGWAADWRRPAVAPDDLAFLQYTSGSTGRPRGVMVSHGNLLANLEMIRSSYRVDGPHVLSWLPPYHDMGLIGGILGPMALDATGTLMSTIDFIKNPMRWPRAISHFDATISGGPNFAYALAARRATPEAVASLDLSRWQLAFCGAEPVRAETLREFARAFAPAGFHRRSFNPTYGLAEATLLVTGGNIDEDRYLLRCDAKALERGRVARGDGKELVSCGAPILDAEVAIMRADGRPAAPDEVGEIAIRGRAVARGYWELPEASRERFAWRGADGRAWLRSGDLGVLRDGQLFITGRSKDLLVIRGRNHYPQDLEATCEAAHPAIRAGCVAAFTIPDAGGDEALCVVAEVKGAALEEVEDALREAIARAHELALAGLALLPPRTIPKTTSGKIQRRACRQAWLAGDLPARRRVEPAARPGGLPTWLIDHLVVEASIPARRVEPERTLRELGLDSIAMVSLAAAAEERVGVELPVEVIFDRSLAEIARWVERAGAGAPELAPARPDLNACAALEPTLRPRARAVSGRDVILTGATGFVGSYLLAELLARSPRRVVCLVRARDPEHGWSRIAETARRLGRTIERARVEVVPADLSRPQLGLTDDVFAALAERAHRVIHCAARVDWSAPFEELRPTNVGGTIEVIRLACLAGGAAIHYVSSIGVVPVDRGGPRSRAGSERVADGERLRLPYFQSKSWPRAPTPFNTPQRAAS